MTKDRKLPLGAVIVSLIPIAALVTGLAILGRAHFGGTDWEMRYERYEHYREFWGGNPSEVYSHWLDMVLMSGNAAALAWLLSVEAFFRRTYEYTRRPLHLTYICAIVGVALSGGIATVLDSLHGEGTVLFAYLIFFIPVLGSSYYVLRQLVAYVRWKPTATALFCVGYTALHIVAQFYYEPSGTGAPNFRIIPIWLGFVGLSLLWALVHSIRTGWLRRFLSRAIRIIRKPVVWGSTALIICAAGVPITLHAHRLHEEREDLALKWLDELETKLTENFVADLKRDHSFDKADRNSRIPISSAAHSLLDDPRIKGENSLRIYIPVNQADYLFLWTNSHFQYCDIRKLVREETVEIDQDFIDSLLAHGGTYQTGLYSILWSPYMAGRVINDTTGKVKAICVINTP